MRRFLISVVLPLVVFVGFLASASGAPPAPISLSFQKIYTDGKDVLLIKHVPVPGKTEKVKYTVKVPIKTKSGIQYRDEQRVRVQAATKEERFPASRDHFFETPDGTRISKEKLISQIPKTGKPVIFRIGKDPLPAEWKELLRKDAVIMRFDPPPYDDEAE